MLVCHSCSAPTPDGARFCPSCGAPQTIEAAQDDERRIVTVLFADLVGFTALSEHRDPESVKRLVDRIFEELVRDVEAHGGVVDKVLGDAIVALFGAPVAHEDDADRAVRAALAMQQSVHELHEADPVDAVQMRVGINTGEVLVGTLAGTDYTAMGDVVNIASRLQEAARPGSVLVGQATRDLCSPAIRLRRVDSLRLRGREQATQAWLAEAVEATRVERRWRSDVSFVGRSSELATLDAISRQVVTGRSAIVSISGEAGIGKSRLAGEAVMSMLDMRPDTILLEGACAPYGETNVWWPVAGALMERLGFDRSTPPDELRRRVEQRLAKVPIFVEGTDEYFRAVELVMHLLGQGSSLDALGPAGLRDEVVAGITEALQSQVARSPVVIWVDDIQWAAPVLLHLLETVARQMTGEPLLIITTCRPGAGSATDWPPSIDPALTLHLSLEALDGGDAAELVARAAERELPGAVVDGISTRSGGNPLFLIELARLAAATDDPTETELPGTLRALIAARLDELTATQRQIIDNAAIIGNEGLVLSLLEFAEQIGQRFDPFDIDAIEAVGLLRTHAGRWHFRSDVVREVAYQTLTKETRAQRHAGVARFLAANAPGLVDRRAYHESSAAEIRLELGPIDEVPDDIATTAVHLLAVAAQGWIDQGAHRRALELIERALALGVADQDVHGRLLLLRVESLVDLHDMRPARLRVNELAAFAERTDNRVLRGESERLRGQIDQADGDLIASRAHLGAAVAEFREIGEQHLLAEALRARGFAELFGGSIADSEVFLSEAEQLFADIGDQRGSAWVSQHQAWASFLSGDHAVSEQRLHHSIAAFDALKDRSGAAWSRGLLAYVYHFTHRDDEALDVAARVLDDADKWSDDWGSSMMRNLQASVWLWRGQIADARDAGERALAGFRRIDDRFGVIQALSTLNRVYVALGRSAEADRSVEEIMVLSDSFGEMAYPVIAAAGTAMHQGQGGRAADLAREAVERLDTTGANVDEGRVVRAFGHLLDGDADSALAVLLDVPVERSAFALAARATALAMLGDRDRALADVQAVEGMGAVSYWDRTVAAVAGLAASDGDEADRRRNELDAALAELDDVVLQAYVSEVTGGETDRRASRPPGGWADVARRLGAATTS